MLAPPTSLHLRTSVVLLTLAAAFVAGCTSGEEPSQAPNAFLSGDLWDDGLAEVAFYNLTRTQDVYGQPADERVLVGTYLVKHDYSPSAEAKDQRNAGDAIEAFKFALFYTLPSGSYEYRRAHVVNSSRREGQPLKWSFTQFDWCSNVYEEMVFSGDRVRGLFRSDDYGNRTLEQRAVAGAVPAAHVPLLVRMSDLAPGDSLSFSIITLDGEAIPGVMTSVGSEEYSLSGAITTAEILEVRYAAQVPSPIGELAATSERYWVGPLPDRILYRIEAADGRYRLEMVESARSAYWEENVFDGLSQVRQRP
ncbi:hypothetical protein BH23BAC4_BH23BAC4_04360 [soil metagenome]